MIYRVTVKQRKDFLEVNGNEIRIGIISKREKGRANKELIEKLAKHFNVLKSNVKIKSGFTPMKKTVEI